MRSIFAIAALLAAAFAEQSTYTVNFVSPQAAQQGGDTFMRTTAMSLEEFGIEIISSSLDETVYSFTVDDPAPGTIGLAMCEELESMIDYAKEICFVDGVSLNGSPICTVSSFKNYAAQCTSNVSNTYYLESPYMASFDKEMIDGLILGLYTNTLIRYVSSSMNGTHYIIHVTEPQKGDFAEEFWRGVSSFSYPGQMCYVTSISDDDRFYYNPSEGVACKPYSSIYKVFYSPLIASKISKDVLDGYVADAISLMALQDPQAAFVGSFNSPKDGIYTILVNESVSGTFGNVLVNAIPTKDNIKCIVSVVFNDAYIYDPPDECYADMTYEIRFPVAALSQLNETSLNEKIDSACEYLFFNDLGANFVSGELAQTGIYTVVVNEQVPGSLGMVLPVLVKDEEQLKCLVASIKSGETELYVPPEGCYKYVEYVIRYPPIAADIFTKDVLDTQAGQVAAGLFEQAGARAVFVNSTNIPATGSYTALVKEIYTGSFGKALKAAVDLDDTLKCAFSSITSGETPYHSIPEECYKEREYEIKAIGGVKKITKEILDAAVIQVCAATAATTGMTVNFTSSEFDSESGIYKLKIVENFNGTFGEGFNVGIATHQYRCALIYAKDDVKTYYTRNETGCYVSTTYNFGVSVNKPDTVSQGAIDKLINMYIDGFAPKDTVYFVSSTFNDTLYAVTLKELNIAAGAVANEVCGGLGIIVGLAKEICHVTYVGSPNGVACYPRSDDTCENIESGVKTAYEVNYYGNLTTRDEIDAFFKGVAKYARDDTLENFRLVNSTYSGNTYKPIIAETATGSFGPYFCDYISNTTGKCDFGPLKADGKEYCKIPECPNGAFGFTPVVFLMALIIAFLF